MFRKNLLWLAAVLLLFTQACSSESSNPGNAQTAGSMQVRITDAPAYGFDHVWITVRDLWFHATETAESEDGGWIKFPLASPVTLDLLELGNGAVSAPVWDNIELPEGDYTQMRVFLARTDAALAPSASEAGLVFNNQVDVTGDSVHYPLRVPDAHRGIMLTGTFTVKKNEKLKLAVDFDAGHDVVKIDRSGRTEFILKPRLAYFDLDNAGAIVGSLDAAAAADPSAHFVIKAEQMTDGPAHVVRRVTALAGPTGRFVLFPLLPGNYDIVIRGINYRTVIVKGVPVVRGTRPDSLPTVMPEISMTPSTALDYAVNASIASPTGAWADFLQTLPGEGEKPYQIRFRHFNPLTGRFNGFLMSSDPVHVGAYDASGITLTQVTPVEGNGGYKAVAGAPLHNHSDFALVTASTNTLSFGALSVTLPAVSRSVSGTVVLPESIAPASFDRGLFFASHGGMIVNAVTLDLASSATYSIQNLPGGTPEDPLHRAFYGIDAIAWSSTDPSIRAVAVPRGAYLRTADAEGVDLTLEMLP